MIGPYPTLSTLGINFDWTITPSTILALFTFLAAIGTFRAGTRAVKKYFDEKKQREKNRILDEEIHLENSAKIVSKIDALIFAFIGSGPNADGDAKKLMFETHFNESMADFYLEQRARMAERKRKEEDKNG